ncbi:hypothetical protein [uncultured Ferrimonas sp.]|uniref:hypothetical protein n=1 Tax=uncultured Ferrimonas sp. TaxID=432640 RepID=UPI00260248B6|nr:hypothetical protein [uncultured Ferrimonas sp.]
MPINAISPAGVATPAASQSTPAIGKDTSGVGAFEREMNKHSHAQQANSGTKNSATEENPEALEDLNEMVLEIRDANLADPTADTSGAMLSMLSQAKQIMA